MFFELNELQAYEVAEKVFDLTKEAISFFKDIDLKSENERVLQSKNSRDIIFQLGKTMERYDRAIAIYDKVKNGQAINQNNNINQIEVSDVKRWAREEYTYCARCSRTILVVVAIDRYHRKSAISSLTCSDCLLLDELTQRIKLLSVIQKAIDKFGDTAEDKAIEWLTKLFQNVLNKEVPH